MLLALGFITVLLASAMLVVLVRAQQTIVSLDEYDDLQIDRERDWPSVTVVVAARNEAHAIEPALVSLLTQDYPNVTVVVVNDRSTDATGATLDKIAQLIPISWSKPCRNYRRFGWVKIMPCGWAHRT